MAYTFIRRLPQADMKGDPLIKNESLRDVMRVSVWISDKLAQIAGEELENLLVVHVWFGDGTKKIFDDCIDVEVL